MSQKPETKFRAKIRPKLDGLPNSWFESISQRSICGTPDIIGCVSGVFVGLELKSSKRSSITAMQAHKLKKIVDAGGHAYIVCPENWEEVYFKLKIMAGA